MTENRRRLPRVSQWVCRLGRYRDNKGLRVWALWRGRVSYGITEWMRRIERCKGEGAWERMREWRNGEWMKKVVSERSWEWMREGLNHVALEYSLNCELRIEPSFGFHSYSLNYSNYFTCYVLYPPFGVRWFCLILPQTKYRCYLVPSLCGDPTPKT
jgi:hypothetical protein